MNRVSIYNKLNYKAIKVDEHNLSSDCISMKEFFLWGNYD